MKYDRAFFDTPLKRRDTRSVKWDSPAMCPPGDLPMWVADWDFRCAQPIVQALEERAQHPCYGYNCEDPFDAQALCGFWQRRHHLTIEPKQTQMMPCVVTGLKLAVRCFTEPNGGVLYMPPVYGPFCASITVNNRCPVAAPLTMDENHRYSMDFEAIENRLREGARCILFCNPHNPVSRCWEREELQRLLDLAIAYKAVLVSDEIHADFVYSPHSFTPMLSLPGAEKCVLSLVSASKTFNLAGLQQATAVSYNEELLAAVRKEIEGSGIISGNTFALLATQKAYSECDDWLDGLLAYLDESREIIRQELARSLPKAKLSPIEATCLCWIDLRDYAPTCEALDSRLRAQHVVLNRGQMFDKTLGDGYMRLNFACPHQQLREALKRLAAALND